MAEIIASGVSLPSPTQIQISDELIWSSNTGRVTDGTMVGDAIAQKKSIEITWEYVSESEASTISSALVMGFFPVTVLGVSATVYRGTLKKEAMAPVNGTQYYSSVSVTLIQQ